MHIYALYDIMRIHVQLVVVVGLVVQFFDYSTDYRFYLQITCTDAKLIQNAIKIKVRIPSG